LDIFPVQKSTSFAGLFPQENVDLFLDPCFVVGDVLARGLLEDQAGQVCELVDEVEQLTDVVGDGGRLGVHSLQILFVDLAHTFQALVDRFIIGVGAAFRLVARLDQEDCVRHFDVSWVVWIL